MRTGIITQARTGSTRLPGKVLLEAGGRTLLDHHLDRLAVSGLDVYVATTTNPADDVIADLAAARGLPVHRGDEHDVLSRYAGCVRAHDLGTVVRVTSDCPLVDGALVREAVEVFAELDDPWAYVSNGLERSYPRGLDLEVFSGEALLDADRDAREPVEREHVTPYLYRNGSGRMSLHPLVRDGDASAYRITLDTEADHRLIRTLIEEHGATGLDAEGLVALLDAHPELVALNADVEQKALGS